MFYYVCDLELTGDEAAAVWTSSATVHHVQRWRGSRLWRHCTVSWI